MSRHGIVIAGGGLAGQRCAEALRRHGYDGRVALVCGEDVPPYDRPPLSKELLAGTRASATLRLRDDLWYATNAVDVLLGRRAAGVDPVARQLLLQGGGELAFDGLVVATGASPRRLAALDPYDNVLTLRDVGDATALRRRLGPGVRLLVVGGGFVGLEVASTAAGLGAEVTVLEAAPAPLSAVLGAEAGGWFAGLHRRRGVTMHVDARIVRAVGGRTLREVVLGTGERIGVDVALIAVGAAPDTRWLTAAGVPADGVPIDDRGATGLPGVVAAGDAARPRHPLTGVPHRSEHWDAAARGGLAAARTLLDLAPSPAPPPFFWSDQHGVRIQLVGDPHAADRTTLDGDPTTDSYTLTYWRRDVPAGVLLVGCPQRLVDARRLLARGAATDSDRRAA